MSDLAIEPAAARTHTDRRGKPSLILALAFVVLAATLILAIFGHWLRPHDPGAQNLLAVNQPPDAAHWLGTDGLGRDMLSRVIAGSAHAVIGPLLVALTGLVLSGALGIASGYLGGMVDMVIQRFVDFMFALPGLLVAIVVVGVIGGGYWLAVLVLAVLNFTGDVRIVRGAALEQRTLPYIEAARAVGVPKWRIMYVHIFRNITPLIVANAAIDFALALVALAGLAFLGLGSAPGDPEWGRLLTENREILFTNPAAALAPGLALVLLATSVNLIGDWVYDRYALRGRNGR